MREEKKKKKHIPDLKWNRNGGTSAGAAGVGVWCDRAAAVAAGVTREAMRFGGGPVVAFATGVISFGFSLSLSLWLFVSQFKYSTIVNLGFFLSLFRAFKLNKLKIAQIWTHFLRGSSTSHHFKAFKFPLVPNWPYFLKGSATSPPYKNWSSSTVPTWRKDASLARVGITHTAR